MTDYTELKRLADAAKNWGGEVGEDRWYVAECFKQPYFSVPDAEFIAACDPGKIRALIAENEQLRDGANMRAIRSLRGDCADLLAERDQLKAENDALRRERDARHPLKPLHEPAIGFTGCVICGVYTDHGGLPCPKTRAAAIALSMENQRLTPVEPLRVSHPLDAALGQGEQS